MSDAKHSAPLGVIEVLDAQKNGDLEASGCTVDLKRYANLFIVLVRRKYLDAYHCNLKFIHHPDPDTMFILVSFSLLASRARRQPRRCSQQ
jgi:hypothetical protein